ncbi:MAG: GntR family transcriptional regulator [Candidatus Cloacimonadota bacterium]|nr:MAG: GntR family transcriptional regulator [Candidatus Cloacimonadota bacterium]
MISIGRMNSLEVVKRVDFGLYLDGGEAGEILLPKNSAPRDARPGSKVEVFIYHDSESRLIATTLKPFAMAEEFAELTVKDANDFGAFMDWGLMKDLLVPTMEQQFPLQIGKTYLIYITKDKRGRLFGTTKFDKYMENFPTFIEEGEEVDILIAQETDLGFKAVINNRAWGMIYKNEIFREIKIGNKMKAYVKKIREDGRVDLSLQKEGYERVKEFADVIFDKLRENNGFIPLNDKSSPEKIYSYFGVSKKVFKKTAGSLYKQKKIEISDEGIRIL